MLGIFVDDSISLTGLLIVFSVSAVTFPSSYSLPHYTTYEVTRQGHSDEVTRLDVGLVDSLIRGRKVHLTFTIMRHILSTPAVSNQSLPYGSIISKILRHFDVPLIEPVYVETKKLGMEYDNG